MSIVGRTYMEAGRPVVVLVQWRLGPRAQPSGLLHAPQPRCRRHPSPTITSPRNVLIRRDDGTLVVRPFRGLRKAAA